MSKKKNLEIEYFFVGQDIQVQINHEHLEWRTGSGDLDTEYLFDELGNGELVQADEINGSVGCSLWAMDGHLYDWNYSDIENMLKTGFSKMYHIGTIAQYADKDSTNDIDFVKWYYNVDTDAEALKLIN